MKVAHIFKALNPGGIETWLKDLSYIEKNELHYLLLDNKPGFFDQEVAANGVRLVKTPFNLGLIKYSTYLYKYFKSKKIDVVHSHVNLASGWMLFIAFLAGVPKRVAHCHNDKRSEYNDCHWLKKFYFFVMKIFVHLFSNIKISVSEEASASMFYGNSEVQIIPCGLSFAKGVTLNRSDFNLASDDIVISHVGRFVNQKNHDFILDIASMINNPKVKFLLVGQGELQDEVKRKVLELGLKDKVRFLNIRNDINNILFDLSDIFILPSKFEGLGLVAVEAQSNHVYTLVSDKVPKNVAISKYIEFLPISKAEDWAEKINWLIPNSYYKRAREMPFYNERFSIEFNCQKIRGVYIK